MDAVLSTVNVCGAGHSGSTLLGFVLGSHSAAFYAGECAKVRYLDDAAKAERKRVCKICGPDCTVWSGFSWNPERPLYAQIAERVGRRVIVDSTKNRRWIEERILETRDAGGLPHLLFLGRDGRAVINSRLRKYPDRDPEEQIRAWMRQIANSEKLFAAHDGPKIRVRYEELATEPERVARELCAWLGLTFEASMLEFQHRPHHPLGGNNGTQYLVARAQFADPEAAFVSLGERSRTYYENHDDTIRLDRRWEQEMDPRHLELFEAVAGEFNASLRWEG